MEAPAQKAKKPAPKAKKTVSKIAKSNKGKNVKSRRSNNKVSSKSNIKKSSKSKKVLSPSINTQQGTNTSLFPAAAPAVDTSYNAAALILDVPNQTSLPVSNPGWEGMDPKESMSAAQNLTVAAGGSIETNGAPTPDPIEAPGPLPLLGAGVAFAYSRRLRRRIMRVSTKAV